MIFNTIFTILPIQIGILFHDSLTDRFIRLLSKTDFPKLKSQF